MTVECAAARERALPGNSPAEGAYREDMDDQARSDFLSRRGYRAGDKVCCQGVCHAICLAPATCAKRTNCYASACQVLLYDGVCNLCNGWVNFVMDKDPQARYKFASLQGEAGRALMTRVGRNPDDLSTLVLIECGSQHVPLAVGTGPQAEEVRAKLRAQRAPDETVYIKSEAVLRVVEDVGGRVLGTAAYVARTIIPRSVRDFIYSNCVAPNRYLVFGKSDNCRRVTAALRPRFLDLDQGSYSGEEQVIDLRGR